MGGTTKYPARKQNASYLVSGLAAVDDEAVAPKFPVKFSGKRCFFLGQQVPHSLQVVHETQLGVVEPAKGLVVFERIR